MYTLCIYNKGDTSTFYSHINDCLVSPICYLCFCCSALVYQGIADLPAKKWTESRRALTRLAEARFPEARLIPVDTEQDAVLLLRHLGAQKQRRLAFRSRRSHMLVQSASYTPSNIQEGMGGPPTGLGTLRVSGYIRGRPLQVNRLVHIAGHGDFQLSQIDAPTDPLPIVTGTQRPVKRAKGQDVEMMVRKFVLNTIGSYFLMYQMHCEKSEQQCSNSPDHIIPI